MLINKLNGENGCMHLVVRNGVILALSDVVAEPFIASHVAHSLGNFCQIADCFYKELQSEFGEVPSVVEQSSPVRH